MIVNGFFRGVLGAAALVFAPMSPTMANDIRYSDDATLACLAGQSGAAAMACAGRAARACTEATPAGSTTIGIAQCTEAELKFWDTRLNAAYSKLVKRAKARDADLGGPPEGPIFLALRDMQRAWITFRDNSCEYERVHYHGGTIAGLVWVNCTMTITARQALNLEADVAGQ
ncbi:MAG: lysozyme inhibitor LprI family protein [Pseudomonadota bacterium]